MIRQTTSMSQKPYFAFFSPRTVTFFDVLRLKSNTVHWHCSFYCFFCYLGVSLIIICNFMYLETLKLFLEHQCTWKTFQCPFLIFDVQKIISMYIFNVSPKYIDDPKTISIIAQTSSMMFLRLSYFPQKKVIS